MPGTTAPQAVRDSILFSVSCEAGNVMPHWYRVCHSEAQPMLCEASERSTRPRSLSLWVAALPNCIPSTILMMMMMIVIMMILMMPRAVSLVLVHCKVLGGVTKHCQSLISPIDQYTLPGNTLRVLEYNTLHFLTPLKHTYITWRCISGNTWNAKSWFLDRGQGTWWAFVARFSKCTINLLVGLSC